MSTEGLERMVLKNVASEYFMLPFPPTDDEEDDDEG